MNPVIEIFIVREVNAESIPKAPSFDCSTGKAAENRSSKQKVGPRGK